MPEQTVATVIAAQHLEARAHLLWANAPALATAKPGQFVMVRCGEGEGHDPYLRRPLSIHRVDAAASNIALLFAEVGRGTRWLAQRQPRDVLDMVGPLGNGFTLPARAGARLLLVAGGMGVAPLMALAEAALAAGHSVTLLQGAATAARLYPAELLPAGLQVVAATEDGSSGIKGLVSHLVGSYVKNADAVYACGPVPMYRALAKLKELRDKPVQVSMEARMGCGLGACFGCTIETKAGPKRVCLDGPIFELGQLF